MKNYIRFYVFFLVLSVFSFVFLAQASMLNPESQQQNLVDKMTNPHPATSTEDKKRVAFAEQAVKTLLQVRPAQSLEINGNTLFTSEGYNFNLDQKCLSTPSCLNKNSELQKYIKTIFENFGSIIEFRHAHVIPWAFEKFKNHSHHTQEQHQNSHAPSSEKADLAKQAMPTPKLQSDEYMVHIYTKFENNVWYHLDVIVSEDTNGNLFFRRFFFTKIPLNPTELPEGVVC